MRYIVLLFYIAAKVAVIVLSLPIILVILIGGCSSGMHLLVAISIMIGYIFLIFIGMKGFQKLFIKEINKKLKYLKQNSGFIPILNVLTPDKMAFLGFDSILKNGVYFNYFQDKIFDFSFDDILGCNWTEDKHTVKLEISLKKEKLNIKINRSDFYDFKTRMFAIIGMNV